MKQSVIIENGAIRHFIKLVSQLNAKRIFFVIDKQAYRYSGASEILEDFLKNYDVVWYSDFELNPRIEDVKEGIDLYIKLNPDLVCALGGGSALDMAKLIAGCAVQEGNPNDYITGKKVLKNEHPPIIAIPTTAGTGSEATHFAVVYIDSNKFSMAHKILLPDYVIIDPELTYTLPPSVTSASGLDALSQSIESIWAVGATDESINYASEALKLVLHNLETSYKKPTSESRLGMSKAAYLAGKAINISKTTAPHALSYAITKNYSVPHGIAVSLTLGAFLSFNYGLDESNCIDPRGYQSVKQRIDLIIQILGNGNMNSAQNRLFQLKENLKCPQKLSDVGINKTDIAFLVSKVNTERLSNNPRKVSTEELNNLLNLVY